jgi:hypothetical protein
VKLVIEIPVQTRTPGNSRVHWRTEARRAKEERRAAWFCTMAALGAMPRGERAALRDNPRAHIRLTRISPRRLDTPNVFGALKHVIDGICDALGVDDRDEWYVWSLPTQEYGPSGVRVELTTEGK